MTLRRLKHVRQIGQGGQSLAEFVLCLPVMLLMLMGLLQLGILTTVSVFGHYAASCALRSYTVFYSQGKSLALEKAGQAMQQAFAWCHPAPDLDLEITEESPQDGALSGLKYQGRGPLLFHAELSATIPLLLAFGHGKTMSLKFKQFILSEKTVETD